MNMTELRETISATGFDTTNIDDDMLCELAKAVGITPPRKPKAEVIEYTSKTSGRQGMYVKTYSIPFHTSEGTKASSYGCFVPVEVVEATIADLQLGLELARKKGLLKVG